MDIIKTYITNMSTSVKTSMIDNYKIITVNDKTSKNAFLIYDPDMLVLNSKTLMKLLMIKTLPQDMLQKLTNNESGSMKKYFDNLTEISSLLYEDRIFFDFDPYGNFLLANNIKNKDIKEIITKTTNYQPIATKSTKGKEFDKEFDFSNIVNPYGLEKVVFTGGGTKGILYMGTFLGLLATGQIFYLNHFAGTSVGALTAIICGCATPSADEYDIIRHMTLREILTRGYPIVERYQEALTFIIECFCKRDINTFYKMPIYSFYGVWTALDTIMKNNGLYDPQKSGFQIWYALICKKVCQIMRNGLDKLIIVKKKDGTIVEFPNVECPVKIQNFFDGSGSDGSDGAKIVKQMVKPEVRIEVGQSNPCINPEVNAIIDPENVNDESVNNDETTSPINSTDRIKKENPELYKEYCGYINFDTEEFIGWELVNFFTFQEYNDLTKKTLVLTGTTTKRIETVYYTHMANNGGADNYKDLSVLTGGMASMSIPWIFKAPVINDSYNLDGGIYDNYPLTHCDKKIKDKITHYNNKIFGYLIDDKNSFIDAYEIIRELWIVYVGFIEIMNVGYLKDAQNYGDICELFFEIRSEVYKLLYFTDVDLETFLNRDTNKECISGFSIRELESIFDQLILHSETSGYINFELPKKGILHIESLLKFLDTSYRNFDSMFKMGRKTDLADIMELSIRQGDAFNILNREIMKELECISKLEFKMTICSRYEDILLHLMRNILSYYELKGTFILSNDLEYPSRFFTDIIKNLYKKIDAFDKITTTAVAHLNKTKKNLIPSLKTT